MVIRFSNLQKLSKIVNNIELNNSIQTLKILFFTEIKIYQFQYDKSLKKMHSGINTFKSWKKLQKPQREKNKRYIRSI